MGEPRKSYALFVLSHVLRVLFTLLIFVICAALVWRVFISSRPPKALRDLRPDAALAAVYREKGDLTLFTQEQASVTREERNYGYFGVSRFVFVEESGQVQVLLRYNNSTLKAVKNEFGLDETPPRGVEIFDVSLLRITDLTPEDTTDNTDGSANFAQTRVAPADCAIETTLLYTYLLYTFDGVPVTLDTLVVYLDIYYPAAPVDYTQTPYGTLRLYHAESERISVSLSRAERKALENFNP